MRYAVILAGGSGSRLWPASRRSLPKQFLALGDRPGESLLAATGRRLENLCRPENIVVVTAAAQAEMVRRAMPEWLAEDAIIAEPEARNTAAALGLAAVHLAHRDPDAVLGILPADHHIADQAEFARVVDRAFSVAESHEVIVTVGIVPSRPETGFGYLEVGEPFADGVHAVARFVEKPDAETARAYLEAGTYLWNGGMFFVTAGRLLAEIERYMPETAAGLDEIRQALHSGGAAAAAAAERVYPTLPKISIDYGVMERAERVVTVRGDFGWNDVGSWSALADYRPADGNGNIATGTVLYHEATNNIVMTDDDTAVAVIGISDLVVVKAGNAVLVVPRARAQEVRAIVDALRDNHLDEYL